MEAPEMLRADSSTLTPSDEIRPDDIPVGTNQIQENSDTDQPEVAVITESEVGRFGNSTLLSEAEGTAFGEISSGGDQSVESALVNEAGTPTFEVTAGGALLDGVSKPNESMSAPFFTPRGRKVMPAVTYVPPEEEDKDKKDKKGKKKDVDPKNSKDTKQTKDAKPAKK